jgi:hypothetical protein
MKNRNKDGDLLSERCTITEKIFMQSIFPNGNKKNLAVCKAYNALLSGYLIWYITSFTSFTVFDTSGNAAATRLGA